MRTCVFDVLPATVGHFVCKIVNTQLVYDFSALNRGPNSVHVIFSLFFNIPLYARVGNLQPFARIHKSWTVLICNVVLGLNVEFRSMSSVDVLTNSHTHTHTHTHTKKNTAWIKNIPVFLLWLYSHFENKVHLLYKIHDWSMPYTAHCFEYHISFYTKKREKRKLNVFDPGS